MSKNYIFKARKLLYYFVQAENHLMNCHHEFVSCLLNYWQPLKVDALGKPYISKAKPTKS